MIIPFLDSILLLQLGTAIYTYLGTKDSSFDNDDSDKTIRMSLTSLLIISILFILINGLYFSDTINEKRTILNITLLSIISSVFIFISYVYLYNQSKSPPGYNESYENLEANSDNINKPIKDFNLIIGIISIVITSLMISFYIGYRFFSRETIRISKKPIIIEKVNRRGRAKINLDSKFLF
jgi:uncharacterized membrane-anchored protein